ncbi:MAG: hypothetical protein PHQ32_06530 [Firmicutes bacterium]|nr:hypothetical protein [Bacillota bacterium]
MSIYKIELDKNILADIRKTVVRDTNHSLNKRYNKKKNEDYPAWSVLCAILDRLDDTVGYVNNLVLNTGKFRRSAFDFFDFMNQSAVIINCINELASIYEIPMEEIDENTSIFKKLGNDKSGTDKKYFEYLRSLCSVHPVGTDRHKRYQDGDFECSPFVVWNEIISRYDERGDLYTVVYAIKNEKYHKIVPIRICEIFEYIKYRYEFLKIILEGIKKYNLKVTKELQESIIMKEGQFLNYIDYLNNLINESKNRFGPDYSDVLEFAKKVFLTNPSNNENLAKYKKYCEALKYAIKFEYNGLQNMSFDGFEHCGIKYNEFNTETTLLFELYHVDSNSALRNKYGYQLEKIAVLSYSDDPYDIDEAYSCIETASSLLEKYVTFENTNCNLEKYILMKIGLYFECLDNKCILNKNIPNDIKYRDKLLTEDYLINLQMEESNMSEKVVLTWFIDKKVR